MAALLPVIIQNVNYQEDKGKTKKKTIDAPTGIWSSPHTFNPTAFLDSFFRGYKETITGAMGEEEISVKYDNVLVTASLPLLMRMYWSTATITHRLAKCSG